MSGLYIHIPLCRSKCAYCDFYSVGAGALDAEMFADALHRELLSRVDGFPHPFDTVYIGGGTPSVLPAGALKRIIEMANVYVAEGAEFTVEVNPDDVTPELAALLVDGGVNRVSMGVQSLVDSELSAISRRHDARGAVRAIATLRDAGINNISCDLIYGLPGQTADSFRYSVGKLIELKPEHISAYLLSYEPGTRLTRDVREGKIIPASDAEAENYYHILCGLAAEAGYIHYEISNFALPGLHSLHNSSYWNPANPYLGIGPSAHSFDGRSHRQANVASIRSYIAAPDEAADPELTENLTDLQRFNEKLMLGLRTLRGVDVSALDSKLAGRMMKQAQRWIDSGNLCVADGTRLVIPESSWLIADSILSDLFVD